VLITNVIKIVPTLIQSIFNSIDIDKHEMIKDGIYLVYLLMTVFNINFGND
jgi:hypothetical protein